MFCSNCGRPTDNPEGLCQACAGGPSVATEEFVLGTSYMAPKKSKKGLVVGIVAAVAAVAVGVGAFFLLGDKDSKKNEGGDVSQLAQKVEEKIDSELDALKYDSPKEHFVGVNSVYIRNVASGISDVYGQITGSFNGVEDLEMGTQAEIHVLLGDQILSMVESSLDMDADWLSDIKLSVDISMKDQLAHAGAAIGLGKTDILSVDMIVDLADYVLYMAIPELSDQYMELDIEEAIGVDIDDMIEELMNSEDMMLIIQFMDALPEDDELEDMITRYLEAAFAEIDDVSSYEDTLQVGSVEQDCTVLSVEISQELVMRMALAIFEEAKDDDVLKNMLVDIANLSGADYSVGDFEDMIQEIIDEGEEALEDAETNTEFTIVEYLSEDNKLIGLCLARADDMLAEYYNINDGKDFAFELALYGITASDSYDGYGVEYGEVFDTFRISGEGKTSGGKINGEYTVASYDEEILTLEVKDLDEDFLSSGKPSGTIILILSDEALDMNMDLELEIVLDKGDVEMYINADGEMLAGITVSSSDTSASSVKIPSKTLDIMGMDESDMMEWVLDMDFDTVLKNAKKAGVPEELTDYLEQFIDMMAMYG